MMSKPRLTKEEKTKIIMRVNVDNVPVTDVAKEFGVSRKSVYMILNGRTRIENASGRPPISEELRAEIVDMVSGAPSYSAASLQLNLTSWVGESTINKILLEEGFICKSGRVPYRRRPVELLRRTPNWDIATKKKRSSSS